MKVKPAQIREQAAQFLAEGRFEYQEIAEKIGITVRALHKWRRDPKFAARVDELSREFSQSALKRAIARKEYRVNVLANKHSELLTVMEERAVDPELAGIPGGKTGLVVRKPVTSKDGICGYEFVVDTGTLKELRSIQEQVAKELGQLVEKKDVKLRSLKDMTDEELAELVAEVSESGDDSTGSTEGD